MRIPITDQFLLNLYNFIEKLDKTFDLFAPRTMKEAFYPDIYKLRKKYARKRTKKQFTKLIYYLKNKGYIKIKNLEEKQEVILTKRGVEKVLKIQFRTMKKRGRPDGKWQMVIFDIPERKRDLRDIFRENLQLLGYRMLQQSVWVCPFDVLKETEGVIRQYELDDYIRLFLIEELEI